MNETLEAFFVLMFMWLPLVFAAYAMGRGQVGSRFLLVFIAAEAAALAKYLYPGIVGSILGWRE